MKRILTITRRAMGKAPGSELRLRGKWLYDFGFKPGMRVMVFSVPTMLPGYKVLSLWARTRSDQPKRKP